MREKRVLHCLSTIRRAGAQSYILNLYNELYNEGFLFDFLIRCPESVIEPSIVDTIHQKGGNVYNTPSFPRHIIANYRKTKAFFEVHHSEYMAVHVHANSFLYVLPLIFAKKYGIKIRILHSHNSKPNKKIYSVFHKVNKALFMNTVTHKLACSDLAGQWMYGTDCFTTVENGVDISRFSFQPTVRNAVRQELHLPVDSFVIGNIGRFVPEKNHRFMVEVFSKLSKQKDNAYLVLAGIGSTEEEIKALVIKKKLNDKIIFLGLRHDAERLYQAFDVFFMPSFYEGLPFTLIEAQCASLPCVISDSISSECIISSMVFALSIDDEVDLWVKTLTSVNIQGRNSAKMEALFASKYNMKNSAKKVQEIYEQGK